MVNRCKGEPLCKQQNYYSSDFRVSPGGYLIDTLTQDLCKELCAEQKFTYSGFVLGNYCLCGNDTTDFKDVDPSLCNIYCSGNPEEVCGSNDTNIIYMMEATQIGTIDNIAIDINDIFTNALTFFADYPIPIHVAVEASTKVEVKLRFGDGTMHTFTDEPFDVEKFYRIPGEYTVHASVQDVDGIHPAIFDEKIITVEDRNTTIQLICPTVVKPEVQTSCSLFVSSGTFLHVSYQMSDDDSSDSIGDYDIPDSFYTIVGQPIPPTVDEAEMIDISYDKVYLTYAMVKSKSLLLGFEYYVKDKGKFELLVLSPECFSSSYCEETSACGSTCSVTNVRKCEDNKPLCSYISRCVDPDFPLCSPTSYRNLAYVIKHSFEVASDTGYGYFSIPSESSYDVMPGDIIGFKTDGASSLWCRNSSAFERVNGIEDTSDNVGLGVLHLLRAILVEPVNISLRYTYNVTGNYSVELVVEDFWSTYPAMAYLPVQTPVSDVDMQVKEVNIIVGKEVYVCVKANGSSLNLYWDYFGSDEEDYVDGHLPEEGIYKNITCTLSGDYVLNLNVSNLWNSESVSTEFHCFLPIGRNWTLTSDSPKSTPPGDVSFGLKFEGSVLPGSTSYTVDFGDGPVEDVTEITSESHQWQTSFTHSYGSEGNFTITVNISNPVDFEIFELTVKIFEKMANLSVAPFFVKTGSYPENRSELKGKDNTDTPVHATVYFENSITGHVTFYKMEFDDESYHKNSSEDIISHSFPEVGEWNVSFTAWNSYLDEYSNKITLMVRVLADVSDFDFNASTSNTEVDSTIEFEIMPSNLDAYTCIMFAGGDEGSLVAFGNRDVCTLYYDKGRFKFIQKSPSGSSRKRRGTSKAEWKDDSTISILYSYAFGGDFPASVDVFNSVSRKRRNITIAVSDGDYKTPLVWIDKNSTDIENPIECQRGYDCRYETTAIFRSDESFLASHQWTAFMIDSGGIEEEVDLTNLKTQNCSAIRIVKRSLDIGLYKIRYTLTVYGEDHKDTPEKTKSEEEQDDDYYYRAKRVSDDEEENYSTLFENRTILGRRSVFSYLRIIPTPLIPMLINGGASYLVLGFGQTVDLEPTVYTVDPDFPDDQNYDVTWFCLRSDLDESLKELGEHNYGTDNPSKPIADRSTIKEEDYKGGCFGKGPGLVELESSDYKMNTDSFWAWDAVYEMIAVIRKSGKVTEGHLIIKVVESRPPSLRVMCEKKIACFPAVRGQYINPSSWVPLKVECVEDCGDGNLSFEWSIYASDLKTRKRNPIENWKKHVTVDFDRMGCNQSLSAENPDVSVFIVEVAGALPDTDIPKGFSSLFLLINHPPQDGKCSISASSRMALLDVFMVEFSDWDDEEGHEITDYSIYVKFGNESLRLSYGLKRKVHAVLPYGDLQVWCFVKDHLGAVTSYSAANFSTMLPTEKELEDYDQKRFFDRCLAEGKMSLASQIIIARNSIIMEYKRLKNRLGDFDDVSEHAIDERWGEYVELDGIDSSYYSSQAKDEIREILREEMEKQMDRDSKVKNKAISKVLRLPMEALPDAEIFGGALNSIAENGPTDFTGKIKLMRGMESMFQVINDTEVPHPENKKTVFSQFGNLADTIAGSLAASNIGGKFLPAELKRAEEVLDHNATEPNTFIYYIEGNRSEVQRNLKGRAVEAAKGDQMSQAKDIVVKIKEMVSSIQVKCMEEIMVGPEPFYTDSRSGFQMTFLKKPASNLSGEIIQQGDSTVLLPDLCKVLNIDNCEESGATFGVQTVRWTQPLESYGIESSKLSADSNVIQVEITPREGNSSILIRNSTEPFKICIPNHKTESKLEYIKPSFSRDDDILVYHTLFIESPGIAATVNIKPDDPTAPLIVLYRYGELPSLLDYDYISQLQDIKPEKGIYSLFIGSEVITESGKNLSVGIGHAANTTDLKLFFVNPGKYNLSVVNMTNQFSTNYGFEISTTGCYYFSDDEGKWMTKGCRVVKSNPGATCCECNHLTSFGSGFFISPNEINFSYVFAHVDFKRNITIYATIIVIFSVFILFLIYARWKDRKDIQKLGATPLPDNEAADKYIYEILVFTGHQRNAGTKSNVFFIASGEDDETEVRHIGDDKRPILQKGSVDVFVMSVPRSLGQLNYLRIWHDNSGTGKWSSWYCQYIVFRDVQTGFKYEFLMNKWFAVEHDDGMIDRLIPVAGKEQVTEFSHLFSTSSRRNLADNHLWFSVFLRPPRSRFSRVQRVSCCMAVLCLSMLSNAMYYERTSAKPASGGFKFGPFSLSPEQIGVGLITNFLIFPPTFLMIFFFRKSRPRKLRPSRIEEALKHQRVEWKRKNPVVPTINPTNHRNSKSDTEAQLLHHRKKKFSIPWWCIYFGWLLVIASIGASMFFMWAYGISFGDEKTSKWISSLIVAFISSVLITQPIKVILMAIVVSCMCKSMDYDEDDADEDEEEPHLRNDEEYLHDYKRSKHVAYQPMDLEALEEARKEREKEVKMYSVLREILAYFFFLWVIMILSYGNRDPNNFFLRQALINGFIKPGDLWVEYNNVNTERRFWNWTYNALVPELFALQWYNRRDPLGLRLYLDDRNNLKIGYAVLRQVRIQPRSCKVSWLIESITPECAGYSSVAFEDGTLYTKGWRTVNSTETLVPLEYKYLTAAQLKGFPFWGQIDWYGGGGYVVPLVAKRDSNVKSLVRRLQRLEKEGWIDRHTRAVFVEFGIYNAQINLFCAVTILAEFLPGGGVVPYYHIDPLRLLNYYTGFGMFQIAIEILFVVFTIFFTVKELKGICRERTAYFSQYWNIAELVSIVVSYTGIANHIYKLFVTAEILRVFVETEGTGYVKLQEAVLLNELFCYQIGLVMSISTLKFLKLLRFNKRIGILSSTLRRCTQELQGYSVCLIVVFMAFVILFWLLLGRNVREFCTFTFSFESSISMMLKKFNYEDMYAAQPVFTPIAFFTFSLATAVVLINILLSIIIRSFEDVKHDVNMQSNEYEIMDFFINRLKMLTGCGKAKVRPMPSMYREKKKPKDSVSSFPDKVDRLVDFINDFYFENQMDFSDKDFLKKMNSDSSAAAQRETRKAKPIMAMKSKIPKSVADRFDDF